MQSVKWPCLALSVSIVAAPAIAAPMAPPSVRVPKILFEVSRDLGIPLGAAGSQARTVLAIAKAIALLDSANGHQSRKFAAACLRVVSDVNAGGLAPGSLWRDFAVGRLVSGADLPEQMLPSDKDAGRTTFSAFMRLAAIYRIVIATGSHLGSCAANWCLLPKGAILALEQEFGGAVVNARFQNKQRRIPFFSQNWVRNGQPRSSLHRVLLLSAALILGGGVARGGTPLAAELYQIFGLHVGDHAYLKDYAALINSVPRDARRSGATLSNFFKTKARPRLRRLVAAINSGADPTALRDQILTSLKLGQRYGRLNGKPWPYGPMYLRLAVGSAMYREAVALDRAHHPRAARRWLRAAVVLNAQDDVLTGPRMILSPLVPPKAWPDWQRLVKLAPAQAAGDVKGYRQNMRILDLSPEQKAALMALYRRRIRPLSGPVMKAANTFGDPEVVLKASPDQRGAMQQGLLESLSLFARSHATMGAQYELLDNAAWVRSQLKKGGLAGASQSILKELRGWELRVRRSGSIRPLYRKALLRWIKEAMGP